MFNKRAVSLALSGLLLCSSAPQINASTIKLIGIKTITNNTVTGELNGSKGFVSLYTDSSIVLDITGDPVIRVDKGLSVKVVRSGNMYSIRPKVGNWLEGSHRIYLNNKDSGVTFLVRPHGVKEGKGYGSKGVNSDSLLTLSKKKNVLISGAPASLPAKYDLRAKGLVTSVKNQGSTSNCWSFASVASMESNALKNGFGEFDFSENNMKNSLALLNLEVNGGGTNNLALAYLNSWKGPVTEKQDPYNPKSFKYTSGTQVIKLADGDMPSGYNIESLKKLIMANGAMSLSMLWSDLSAYYNKSTCAYYNDIEAGYGHAVTVVGWDDNYNKNNFGGIKPPENGCWIVKNSWGTEKGKQGYYYISYYSAKLGFDKCSYTLMDKSQSGQMSKLYSYNKYGWGSTLTSTGKYAVKYPISAGEVIQGLGINTTANNTNIRVSMGYSLDNMKKVQDFYEEFSGWHTLTLDNSGVQGDSVKYVYIGIETDNPGVPLEGDVFGHTSKTSLSSCFVYDPKSGKYTSSGLVSNIMMNVYTNGKDGVVGDTNSLNEIEVTANHIRIGIDTALLKNGKLYMANSRDKVLSVLNNSPHFKYVYENTYEVDELQPNTTYLFQYKSNDGKLKTRILQVKTEDGIAKIDGVLSGKVLTSTSVQLSFAGHLPPRGNLYYELIDNDTKATYKFAIKDGKATNIDGLNYDTKYSCCVACYVDGYVVRSNQVNLTTYMSGKQLGEVVSTCMATSFDTVELSWNKLDKAKYYEIQYSDNGENWQDYSNTFGENKCVKNKLTISGLEPQSTIFLRVRAVGESNYHSKLTTEWSTTWCTTLKLGLSSPKAKVADDGLTIIWDEVKNATEYILYDITEGKCDKVYQGVKTQYTVNSSLKGHYFVVKSYNSKYGVYSPESNLMKLEITTDTANDIDDATTLIANGDSFDKTTRVQLSYKLKTIASKTDQDLCAVTLSWNRIPNAICYDCKRYTSTVWNGSVEDGATKSLDASSVTFTNIPVNTAAQFSVTPIFLDDGDGKKTGDMQCATIYTDVDKGDEILNTPEPKGYYEKSSNRLRVSWEAIPHATSYTVVINGKEVTSNASSNKFNFMCITNVRPELNYFVEVRANSDSSTDGYRESEFGSFSLIVPRDQKYVMLATDGIALQTFLDYSENKFRLYWNDNNDGKYVVKRRIVGKDTDYKSIAELKGSNAASMYTFEDTSVPNKSFVSYRIEGVSNNKITTSNKTDFRADYQLKYRLQVLPVIANVATVKKLAGKSKISILVKWVSDTCDTYQLETFNSKGRLTIKKVANSINRVEYTVGPKDKFGVRIRAVRNGLYSEWSNPISITYDAVEYTVKPPKELNYTLKIFKQMVYVNLKWVGFNGFTYNVYTSSNKDAGYKKVASNLKSETYALKLALTNKNAVYIKVSCVDRDGQEGTTTDPLKCKMPKIIKYKNATYVGSTSDTGKPQGTGTMTWESGARYVGNFDNGVINGFGNFVVGNNIYIGNFKAGKRSGYGFETYHDVSYSGNYLLDKRDGSGALYRNNVKIQEGYWVAGVYKGKEKPTPTKTSNSVLNIKFEEVD